MGYDYKKSRQSVIEELTQPTKITTAHSPKVKELTFENGKRARISACFVDIRNSSKLFADNSNKGDDKVARLMRAFSGEIIKIMRDKNYIHIGLQGDCVYGVFSTPKQENISNIFSMAATINSFVIMLNKVLQQNKFEPIKVGIGLGTGEDLIIKVGANNTGINDVLFIGSAVAEASNNADAANKLINYSIVVSSAFYNKLNEHNKKLISNKYTLKGKTVYAEDIVNSNMRNWIKNDFREN